jgi:hypothetical protein
MSNFTQLLKDIKDSQAEEKAKNDVIGNVAIASLESVIDNGYQMTFANAKILLQGIILSASRNEDGAYYNWDALKEQLKAMNTASQRYWSEE